MAARLTKRADGRYQVTATVGVDPVTGKRARKLFYGTTQKEAMAKRDEWLAGVTHAPKELPSSVSAFADFWLNTYARGQYSSMQAHAMSVKKIKDFFGNMPLRDVLPATVASFSREMEGYSKSYVSKISHDLQNVFSEAVHNRLIDINPCDGILFDNAGEDGHRILEAWERETIVELAPTFRCGAAALLMLYGGMRPGEALAVTAEDVSERGIHIHRAAHFEHNTLVTLNDWTKTGNKGMRTVPILPQLEPVLRWYPTGRLCGSEFTGCSWRRGWETFSSAVKLHHAGIPLCANGTYAGIRRDRFSPALQAKLDATPDIRPYDLRHTYCTLLFDAGVDIKTAQYLMGHSTPEMTMRVYTHLTQQRQDVSVNKLLQALRKTGF